MVKININQKLNSADYKCKLSSTLTAILRSLRSANSEATVASIFENELYFLIKSYFNKEVVFYKEIGESFLRHSFNGRLDLVTNDLIIEYKALNKLDSESDKTKAINQVVKYLNQIYSESGSANQAILTNGKKLCYFYFDNENVKYTAFRSIDENDINRIVKTILNVGTKQFNPRNILRDFKIDSEESITKSLAFNLYKTIKNAKTQKTNMLYEEWQVLFRLSESDKGQNQDIVKRRSSLSNIFGDDIDNTHSEYTSLYVLQTTYAIIVKLIACKVLSKLTYNDDIMYFSDLSDVSSDQLQEFTSRLEDGYVFSAGGIKNLLEGDFFSWYSDSKQWNSDISESIKKIISELENYSSSSFSYEYGTIDIFKDLYMQIMPNELRHSLGEYFTPDWLADQVVNEAISQQRNSNWRGIDPCCGSGVFIVSMIKNIQSKYDLYDLTTEEKTNILNDILLRVQGVDLNPLSVLTARVSYLLAIMPLFDSQKFEIPIYLGDSADIPRIITYGNIDCYSYTINTKQGEFEVTLPIKFVIKDSFFENMNMLQTTIKAEDEDVLIEQLIRYIGNENLNKEIESKIEELGKNLVKLHKNDWDGIWVRIVSNFMLIARIRNIDIIIGNPPWVKWEFLPQNYAEKIKRLCVDRHLFSGQTYMGAISLNLCALIANVTASYWLNKDGVLAFLMPKTIMTQDSYAGFRNFYINNNDRLYLQRVDDWSKAGNPFVVTTEKFLTYYYKSKYVDYSTGIPIKYYTKKKGVTINKINWFHSFKSVSEYFTVQEGMAYQLDQKRTGFSMVSEIDYTTLSDLKKIIGQCDYKARSGVEFTPAEVYFIEPVKNTLKADRYIFKSSEFTNSVYKKTFEKEFELETKYIRPVIKSPHIKPFEIIKSNNYCIFPYDYGNRHSVKLNELIIENEQLANYLIESKKTISKQSKRSKLIAMGNDFYSLSKVGKYTFAPYKVTFRDNTVLDAAVVMPLKTPWGEVVTPICAKHSPYISMDKENNYITEAEAFYICAILNTKIVKDYFKYTYSGRSYSINFNIKIPKFDTDNKIQNQLSTLAKQATFSDNSNMRNDLIRKIGELYLDLCDTIK